MISNNYTFKINCYNDDINVIVENTIIFMILTILLYFTLEDNLDTKIEINYFISKPIHLSNCSAPQMLSQVSHLALRLSLVASYPPYSRVLRQIP